MTRFRRVLIAAAGSLVGVPLLVLLISPIAWSLLRPKPIAVASEEIPDRFPVLGYWQDSSGPHCRASLHRDLIGSREALPAMSHFVRKDDLELCTESFRRYNETGEWADAFPGIGRTLEVLQPATFEIREIDARTVEVFVAHDRDDDAPNDAWYEVATGSNRLQNLRYHRYFGPGLGIATLAVSVAAGIGTYLVLATFWIFRGAHRPSSPS